MLNRTSSSPRFPYRKASVVVLLLGLIGLLSFSASGPEEPPFNDGTNVASSVEDFENIAPIVKAYWVTMLTDTLADGSNLQMRIEYYDDPAIKKFPPSLDIYTTDDGRPTTFYDDGTNGDSATGDFKYSAFFKEDIGLFIRNIQDRQAYIQARLPFDYYVGRTV